MNGGEFAVHPRHNQLQDSATNKSIVSASLQINGRKQFAPRVHRDVSARSARPQQVKVALHSVSKHKTTVAVDARCRTELDSTTGWNVDAGDFEAGGTTWYVGVIDGTQISTSAGKFNIDHDNSISAKI
jgi:hypothetical protein